MRARKSGIIAAALALAFGVAGCSAHGQVTTGTPRPPATAAPASGATSATFGTGKSLVFECDQLLDSTFLAQLDPGLTPDPVTTPEAGSSAEEALAIAGTACSWTNESAATTLVVTAALPDAATFATLKAKASTLTPDPEFDGVPAFTDGTELQLFTQDGAWATATSDLFADPAKLTLIGQVLLEELPAG